MLNAKPPFTGIRMCFTLFVKYLIISFIQIFLIYVMWLQDHQNNFLITKNVLEEEDEEEEEEERGEGERQKKEKKQYYFNDFIFNICVTELLFYFSFFIIDIYLSICQFINLSKCISAFVTAKQYQLSIGRLTRMTLSIVKQTS